MRKASSAERALVPFVLAACGVVAMLAAVNLSSAPPALIAHRARTELPVYDVVTGRVRTEVALLNAPEGFGEPGALRLRPSLHGEVAQTVRLGPDEFYLSNTAIRGPDGRLLSMSPNSFGRFEALRSVAIERDSELFACALSMLTYVTNGEAVRRFLASRGTEVLLAGGALSARPEQATSHDATFFIARHDAMGTVLAVRGSQDLGDLRRNLHAAMLPMPGGGHVHAGFWSGAHDVLTRALPLLRQQYAREGRLSLTGHSLGGAIVHLVHSEIAAQMPAVRTFAFAPPPIGDADFVQRRAGHSAGITSYFLPGEEIELLGGLNAVDAARALRWIGARQDLRGVHNIGIAHYLINYFHAMLVRRGEGERWWNVIPHCVIAQSDCFEHVESRVPRCALRDPSCEPRVAGWTEMDPSTRLHASTLPELVLELRQLSPVRRPFRLYWLAALSAAAGRDADRAKYLAALAASEAQQAYTALPR